MRTNILYIITFLLLSSGLSAQRKGTSFSPEEAINQKWTFIKEKANLNSEEAQIVEPVFRETEAELWKLISKSREVFRQNRQKGEGITPNFELINESMVNFEVDNALNQKQYYLRLKSAKLPESTINRILNAEKDYKRDLMQRMSPGRNKGQKMPESK